MTLLMSFFDNLEDKNPSNSNYITPLHEAARHGHLLIVQTIMGFVKESNQKATKDEWTPMHGAASNGQLN